METPNAKSFIFHAQNFWSQHMDKINSRGQRRRKIKHDQQNKKNNKEYDETYQLGNQQYETSYKE